MKAILVVDIEETNLNECEISYVIQDKNGTALDADTGGKLKPMPSRMKVDYDTIVTCEVTEKVVAMGWNACIDEILGVENETE